MEPLYAAPQTTHSPLQTAGSKRQTYKATKWLPPKTCKQCGNQWSLLRFHRGRAVNESITLYTKRDYCSKSCAKKAMHAKNPALRRHSGALLASVNKGKPAWNNKIPMRESTRSKLSKIIKQKGDRLRPYRGGNGRGMSPCETLLQQVLPSTFFWNYSIPTKQKRSDGYPHCYKVDFGNPSQKIAIEVDGASHQTRTGKERDSKKTSLLQSLGWRVLRISNQTVRSMFGISK